MIVFPKNNNKKNEFLYPDSNYYYLFLDSQQFADLSNKFKFKQQRFKIIKLLHYFQCSRGEKPHIYENEIVGSSNIINRELI